MTLRGCSSVAEQQAFPLADGGSIPTYPLHVQECKLSDIKAFIERQHYSHSVFGITGSHFFSVHAGGELHGGAIFGAPAAYNVAAKYGADGLVELRRFCLSDDLPRNSESRALAVMFRILRRAGVKRILSYADPAAGHAGIIYRATGFEYLGTTAKRRHLMWKGKKYPDRNLHQTKFPFHLELRAAVANGEATRIEVPGKHIYLKELAA